MACQLPVQGDQVEKSPKNEPLPSDRDSGAYKGAATVSHLDLQPPQQLWRFALPGCADAQAVVAAAEADPEALSRALDASQGLLFLPGLHDISNDPELLVRLSRLFGMRLRTIIKLSHPPA